MSRLTLTLNSHSLSAFQSCAKKYWLGSAENLVSLGTHKPFELGSAIHLALFRMNRAKIRRSGLTSNQNLTLGQRALSRTALYKASSDEDKIFYIMKLTQYVAWRSSKSWLRCIGAEVGFSKILYEDRDVVFFYEGRIDDVSTFEDGGTQHRCWLDYKTQSRETHYYYNRNQFLGYSWALGTNYGFIIPFGLQKEKSDCFSYKSIYHSAELITQWREDTIRTFREIINKVPFGETEFRRNRSACDAGNYGLCSYVRLCDSAYAERSITEGIKRTQFKTEEWRSW